MSVEQKKVISNEKRLQLVKLRNTPAIYVLMSNCTKMPYVKCDDETFDDEVFIYFKEEDIKKEVERLKEEKIPVHSTKIVQRFLLPFYSSLFPMGVNSIVADHGTEGEYRIQIGELLNRKMDEKENKLVDAQGRQVIENQELVLTALYFMQKLRANPASAKDEDMKELQEEMLAHYAKGKYIIALGEDKSIPILKQKDGKVLQPVFTDIQEFAKFQSVNKQTKLRTAVVEAAKIAEVLPKEASGIVLNPFSFNLQLQIQKKVQKQPKPMSVEQLVTQTLAETLDGPQEEMKENKE